MLGKLEEVILWARIYRHGLAKFMRIFSHSAPRERYALYTLAKSLPNNARALEIGSHLGSSALFICAGLSETNGKLICVDTWMNETMSDGTKDTYSEFRSNTRHYADRIIEVRKNSLDLVQEDLGGMLDFVFIDGDHSEKGVRGDFVVIERWVKIGGLISFHDLISVFPGVSIVVGEAIATGRWELVSVTLSLVTIRRVKL